MEFNNDSNISEIERIIGNPNTVIIKKWGYGSNDGVQSFVFYDLKVDNKDKRVCFEYVFGKIKDANFL